MKNFSLSKKLEQVNETVSITYKTFKLVWNTDKWLLIANFIALVLPAVIPFVNIYIYKLIIDLVVKVVGGAKFDPNYFYALVGIRLFTYFLQDVSFSLQGYTDRILWSKVPINLNQLFYGKLTGLSIQYFENDKFRDLMDKARQSIDTRPQQLISAAFYSMQSLIQVTIAFVALVRLNPFFIVLILIMAIPEFINQTVNSKLSWGIWGKESPFRRRYGYLVHIYGRS